MNTITKYLSEKVYPFFFCPVRHETYFKYFTLIFLFIDSISFFLAFTSSLLSFNPLSLLSIFIRAGFILGMAKIYVDYRKTDLYGTQFAYYYSIVRFLYIILSLSVLILRSLVSGAFSILLFPVHHHKRHFLLNGVIALGIFLCMIFYCLYLNMLYCLVIRKQKLEGDKIEKLAPQKTESEVTEKD